MREVKFRGKSNGNGKWVYGLPKHGSGGAINYICGWMGEDDREQYEEIEVISRTVVEFTGLKDINGIDIYEGDIVHIEYGAGKVVFAAGCFMIEWLDDKEANMELLSMRDYKGGRPREDLVVTGNIHNLIKP